MSAKKVLVFTGVMLLSMASVSYAGLEAGQMEVGVQGMYGTNSASGGGSSFKFSDWSALGSVGYLFTRQMQFSIAGGYVGTGNGSTTSMFTALGQFKFNFAFDKAQTVVPYLGVQSGSLAASAGGYNSSGFSYGGLGGVKFFITENVSLNLEANYLHTKLKVVSTDVDVDQTQFLLGVSFYFGGKK